ncbi:hypothetical protein ACIQXD_01320 [Streptomyces uncialis]|uniref:hypothetical protein n=1 Tax=Streptomyces uncialis TaxID=1048205 RepID=UPI003804FEF5
MERFSHHTRFVSGQQGERAVVQPAGELDLESGSDAEALLSLCIAGRPDLISVDLTLLDRAGLEVLEAAEHRADDAGIPSPSPAAPS